VEVVLFVPSRPSCAHNDAVAVDPRSAKKMPSPKNKNKKGIGGSARWIRKEEVEEGFMRIEEKNM